MIKAETINHEGNPGPNWLDHCRTVFTPWTATLLLVIIAAAVTVIDVQKHKSSNASSVPTSQSKQPAYSPVDGLTVKPVTPAPDADNTTDQVQAAAGVTTAPVSLPDSSANALGAAPTPALNSTSKNGNPSASKSVTQNQLNASSLTNTVQSTVNSAQSVVNNTLKGLTKGLGL